MFSSLTIYLNEMFKHSCYRIKTCICNYSYIEIYHEKNKEYPILHISFPRYNSDICEMSLCYRNRLYGYKKRINHLHSFNDIYYEIHNFFFQMMVLEDIIKYKKSIVSLKISSMYQLSTMDIARLNTDFYLLFI